MRDHTVVLLLVLSLLILVSAGSAPAGDGADSLWAKAVSLHEANDRWVPGSIYIHAQETDKHGEPKDKRGDEIWTRLFLNEAGEVEDELVKILENGEDKTEEEKAKREREEAEEEDGGEEGDGDGEFRLEGYAPFDPKNGDLLTITPTGREEMVNGRRCAVFEFTGPMERDEEDDDDEEWTVMGHAWLEAETGVPFKVEYTTDPLPKRVKKMSTTILYEFEEPDTWYAESMSVQATGGILFIKKHFHMNMTFDDHWLMPEEEPDSVEVNRPSDTE